MRMFAAVVPPGHVVAELADLVASVCRGTDEIDPTPVSEMHVRLCRFGQVALADSRNLARVLREDSRKWTRSEIRFAGGTALEWRGDESVWAKLDGDLEPVWTLARAVPEAVRRLGFFVDRREFKPWLSVGTITDTTSAKLLERLVAALDSYRGPAWTIDEVSLCRWLPSEEPGAHPFEVVESYVLGVVEPSEG